MCAGTRAKKKWRARVYFKGKQHTSGYFENELDCAMEVNKLCRKLGMPLHHPELEIGHLFQSTYDSKKEISPPYENLAVPDEFGDPHDLGFVRHGNQLEDFMQNFVYNLKMVVQDQIQKGVLAQYSQSISAMKQEFSIREARYQSIIRSQEEQLMFQKQQLMNYEYAFERIARAHQPGVKGGIDETEFKREYPFTKTEDLSGSLGEIGNLPKKNTQSNNNLSSLSLCGSDAPHLPIAPPATNSSSPSLHAADLNASSPLHFSIY